MVVDWINGKARQKVLVESSWIQRQLRGWWNKDADAWAGKNVLGSRPWCVPIAIQAIFWVVVLTAAVPSQFPRVNGG